ncbi:MAG: hypothetical protein EOO77_05375 [Oxalobacteraceae bacterium]|nr:MAG: hypothetical protein EOO77_05375 [Oxalobacteraceae bacterium]
MNQITTGMKYFQSLAGTGPFGLAAILIGAIGLLGGVAYMIGRGNKQGDEADLDRGGADAGVTAQTLKNQADLNRDFMKEAREEFAKGSPLNKQDDGGQT